MRELLFADNPLSDHQSFSTAPREAVFDPLIDGLLQINLWIAWIGRVD